MPRLNDDERNQAVGMLNAGTSATFVSQHFGCNRKPIERLRRRFRVTGNVADRPRSGRPRETTAVDDRYIVLQHLRNRYLLQQQPEDSMIWYSSTDCKKSVETKRSYQSHLAVR